MKYNTAQYNVISCRTVQYDTMLYSTIQCNVLKHNQMYFSTVQKQCNIVLWIQRNVVQ